MIKNHYQSDTLGLVNKYTKAINKNDVGQCALFEDYSSDYFKNVSKNKQQKNSFLDDYHSLRMHLVFQTRFRSPPFRNSSPCDVF